jgi:hypothetical protein
VNGRSRREFLAAGFGWFPFFGRRRSIRIVDAEFRVVRRGRSRRRYLHIHGNEITAREILEAHMKEMPGIALLVRNPVRNVPIRGGVIDPNRMFSRAGAASSLRRLNPGWSERQTTEALDALDRARPKFLNALLPPAGGLLVALHNNSEGYSVRDEAPISDRTSLKQPAVPRAFFLAAHAGDYEILAASPYNVVLQRTAPPDDDGSLSRLAARQGIRYVNLEAPLGDAARQREMLLWMERHLPE